MMNISSIIAWVIVLVCISGIKGSISPSNTSFWRGPDNLSFYAGALTTDQTVLLAFGDPQTGNAAEKATLFAIDVSTNSSMNYITNITLGHCDSSVIPWIGNTFFHICNFQSSGIGPTTFNLIQYENRQLTILKTITVRASYGYFIMMNAFPNDGILYLAAGTEFRLGIYIFDVNNTFSLKPLGNILDKNNAYFPNTVISTDQSYFVASMYSDIAQLTKYSLPDLRVISNSSFNNGAQYVFLIPTNDSYASFWIAPGNTNGLIYQNIDYDNMENGATVIDKSSTYFSSGIHYAQTYVDNCFYVSAYNDNGAVYARITQIGLNSPLTSPQQFIDSITINTEPTIIAAGAEAIYVSYYSVSPVNAIYTYPVSCPI